MSGPDLARGRSWFRWTILAGAVAGALALLISATALIVWLAVPWWLADQVSAYSPWMRPAYLALRHADRISLTFEQRFMATSGDKAVVVAMLEQELAQSDERAVCFAAAFFNGICWGEENTGKKVPLSASQRDTMIARMILLLDHPDLETRRHAFSVLCHLRPKEHLPRMLMAYAALSAVPGGGELPALALIDDPAVTSLLVTAHLKRPCMATVNALTRQSDPQAQAALMDSIRDPSGLPPDLVDYIRVILHPKMRRLDHHDPRSLKPLRSSPTGDDGHDW
jgi:hypothetical protein